jgi:microcystin-dependent protein
MAFTKYSSTPADNDAAPPNGMPEGMAPSAVNDCMRDMAAEIRLLGDGARGPLMLLGSVSGTNTITASASPTLGAYAAGQRFVFVAAGANTGATTLNINGLGAVTVYKGSGATALVSGDIPSGSVVEVIYLTSPGNHFRLLSVSLGAQTGGTMPVGAVMPYAGTSAPAGWLFCYGQAISRTDYAALFTALSTTYGAGNGSTTFNLPDLRGRVVAGKDNMGGSSADRLTNQSGGLNGDTLGATGGAETHTLTTAQMPAHTHGLDSDGGISGGGAAARTNGAGTDQQTGSTGDGGAHNNVQPTIILNYIVYAGA